LLWGVLLGGARVAAAEGAPTPGEYASPLGDTPPLPEEVPHPLGDTPPPYENGPAPYEEEDGGFRASSEIRALRHEAGVWEVGPEAFASGRRSFEALTFHVPGWFANSNGGLAFGIGANASGQLGLRGLGGRPTTQLLVMEDGVPDTMGLFGHPLADAHPSAFLSSARVIAGGDSVLYGSGAMAGTLLLETLSTSPRYNGEVAQAYRGMGFPHCSLWQNAPYIEGLEKVGLEAELGGAYVAQLAAHALGSSPYIHRWGAFIRTAHSGGTRPSSQARQTDAMAKAEWALPLGFSFGLRSRVDIFSGEDPGPTYAPFAGHTYEAIRWSHSARLRWQMDNHAFNATAYANLGTHRFWDGFYSKDGLYGLNAEYRWGWREGLQLLWGLDGRLVTGFARRGEVPLSEGTRREGSLGLFAQVEWRGPKLRTVVGGRFQHVGGQNFGLGKAELYYRPLGWLEAHLRAFQNFRSPTLSERYLSMPVANPNLKVERSDTIDVGFALQSLVGRFVVSGFWTYAQNLIVVTGVPPAFKRENVEKLDAPGIEAQYTLHTRHGLHTTLAFSRQWPSTRAMRVPHTQATAQVGLRLPQWAFSLSAATYWGLLSEGFHPLPPVTTTEARVEYIPSRAMVLWLRASNLLGQRRVFNSGYPLPGFEVHAGIRLQMDKEGFGVGVL